MTIQPFATNPLQENTYIVSFEDGRAVIVDCGAYTEREQQTIDSYLQSHHLTLVAHLLTHGHFDHCFGVRYIYEKYGLKPMMHQADDYLMTHQNEQAMTLCGMTYPTPPFEEYDVLTEEKLASLHCRFIHTPGHTPGGVCYLFEDKGQQVLLSGDTLFCCSVGRTDHWGGDHGQLIASIERELMGLPEQLKVLPGHGPSTTIGYEKRMNPFLG